MEKKTYFADAKKVKQLMVATPLGSLIGFAIVYLAYNTIPLFFILIAIGSTALFVYLAKQLGKSPFLEFTNNEITVNNVLSGTKKTYPASNIKNVQLKNNMFTLRVIDSKLPIQISVGMLSKNDLEDLKTRVIKFIPNNSFQG